MVHEWTINDTGRIPWLNAISEEFGFEDGRTFVQSDSQGRISRTERAVQHAVIDYAESASGWTGSGGTVSYQSAIFFQGSGAIKLISTTGGNGYASTTYTYGSGQDFSNRMHVMAWLYMTSVAVQAFFIELQDGTGRFAQYNLTVPYANGWFLAVAQIGDYSGGSVDIVKRTPTYESGPIDLTDIVKFSVVIQENASPANPTIYVDWVHRANNWSWQELNYDGANRLSTVVRREFDTHQDDTKYVRVTTQTLNYLASGPLSFVDVVVT